MKTVHITNIERHTGSGLTRAAVEGPYQRGNKFKTYLSLRDDCYTTNGWLNEEQTKELVKALYECLVTGCPKTIDDSFLEELYEMGRWR